MIFKRPSSGLDHAPLSPLRFLSWNCRGLDNKDTINYLKALIQTHNPNCLFLIETKRRRANMVRLYKRLKYQCYIIVDAKRKAGSMLLLWNEEIDLVCKWYLYRVICCDVRGDANPKVWSLYRCHATPYVREKKDFWASFEFNLLEEKFIWMLIGDLNEVVCESEKPGYREIWERRLFLREVMQFVGAIDLGFSGQKFTLDDKQAGNVFIKERLDRALANTEWLSVFNEAHVQCHTLFRKSAPSQSTV